MWNRSDELKMRAKFISLIVLFIGSVAMITYGLSQVLLFQNNLVGGAIMIFAGAIFLTLAIDNARLMRERESEKLTSANSYKPM